MGVLTAPSKGELLLKSAVIFDLDGVIVSTDEYHFRAWSRMAEVEGFPFDRQVNEFLRGVSRMESLEIILQNAGVTLGEEEKSELCERKNAYYKEMLGELTPSDILPGVLRVLEELSGMGIPVAIGSSSKNAAEILGRIGLGESFDIVVDGNDIARSKPDPEVFLLAAEKLGKSPADCVVVEDAESGVEAAIRAGMMVVGVGSAAKDPRVCQGLPDLSGFDAGKVLGQLR